MLAVFILSCALGNVLRNIFHSIGFEVAQGPEIENDWFNFTALNSPEITQPVQCKIPFTWKAMDRTG
jgi:phenylalanyl-tRNA synthetase alpha chain